MTDDLDLKALLRREADQMATPETMPRRTLRQARLRQARNGVVAVAAVAAVAVVGVRGIDLATPATDVAGGPHRVEGRTILGSGTQAGVDWTLELERERGAECAVLVAGDQRTGICAEREAIAPLDVGVDYIHAMDQSVLVAIVPEGVAGIGISLDGGGEYAGLYFPGERFSRFDYFLRFLPPNSSGLVSTDIDNGSHEVLRFSISVEGNKVRDEIKDVRDTARIAGLEDLPGRQFGLTTGSFAGDPYTLALRDTGERLCLHLEGSSICGDAETVRAERGFALVASVQTRRRWLLGMLLSPDVAEIEVRYGGAGGTDFVRPDPPGPTNGKAPPPSATVEIPADFEGEIVAVDEDGEVIEELPLSR